MGEMMKHLTITFSFTALFVSTIVGCQTGGGGQERTLPEGATPFTTGEMYMYFAEQTQVRKNGGIYYTEYGTLTMLEDGERVEGTWGSYEGGNLCHHIDDREDACEIYYRNGDVVGVAMGGTTMVAPKLMKGNQLDLLATGSARQMYTSEQTTALVSGKTAVWEDSNGAYYAPDGKLITIWDGAKESGKWTVDEKGGICWHVPSWGKTPCEYYFEGPEGLMAVYKGEESPAVEHRDGNQLDNL